MAQAFYPTNDGHVGNVQKLSDIELNDLIQRQERLLKKRSFINHLPDKGAKIKGHYDSLKLELDRRKHESFVRQEKTLSVKRNADEKVKPVAESMPCDRLGEEFEKLQVNEEEEENMGLGGRKESKHFYEVAVERAQQNVFAGLKEQLKLNRKLNVEKVCDLPPEIKKMKDNMTARKQELDKKSAITVPEESAVAPPAYKYNSVQQIDLPESVRLQQLQKQKQEELHAKLAAEKLFQRLNIKTEAYSPEGVDMSYRSVVDRDLDSDDDDDNNAANTARDLAVESSDSEQDNT